MSSPETLNSFAEKGKNSWSQHQKALAAEGADKNSAEAYDSRYESRLEDNAELPANVHSTLKALDLPTKGYFCRTTRAKGGEDAYTNYYLPSHGMIVASWNYANRDDAVQGKRLTFSEVLWEEYSRLAVNQHQPLTALRYVVRSSLQNDDTMAVIDGCFTGMLKDKNTDYPWQPDSEKFFALIATDNCKSIPYMLTDHRNALGRKTVTRIVTHGTSHLYLELG